MRRVVGNSARRCLQRSVRGRSRTHRGPAAAGHRTPDAARGTALLVEQVADIPDITLMTSADDLPAHYASADAVVIMGGYNSVVEAIGRKRRIIVPRDDEWTEQRVRAERLLELGLAVCIRPGEVDSSGLRMR